jgi:exopolysaccharide biosynthesis predicted pyruvyltransferase EpsI
LLRFEGTFLLMTTQQHKTGTIYRLYRVPEIHAQSQNGNQTVVLIKQQHQQQQQHQQEPIARVQKIQTTTDNSSSSNGNCNASEKRKNKRDDQRRYQHNLIERARREKINNWIMELGKIIDDNSDDDNNHTNNNNSTKNGEALSKGGILEKVCVCVYILC